MPRLIITSNPIVASTFEQTDLCAMTGVDENCLDKKDPKDPYTLSVRQLRASVVRFKEAVTNPDEHKKNGPKFIRAAFVDVAHLREIIDLSEEMGAHHVKLYNGIDEGGNHFFFLAPITPDGDARTDEASVAAMCCCKYPPCPVPSSDRYIS